MIRVTQLKLDYNHSKAELEDEISRKLKLPPNAIECYYIIKKSIDARKKPDIKYIYTVDVKTADEKKVKLRSPEVMKAKEIKYRYSLTGTEKMIHRPVIAGSGPSGLFCAYLLALNGFRPLIIERGEPIEQRIRSVEQFWNTNKLNPLSNVQFGEGGAGTFSDGKLNTAVKDPYGRNHFVLETFAKFGAPSEILYWYKPHIGTDRLREVVTNMRNEILRLGGEIRFLTALTGFQFQKDKLSAIIVNGEEIIPCEQLVLAIGHSARDTFRLLEQEGFGITKKAFAVGVRVEHLQSLIDKNQYGVVDKSLPAADYKLTHRAKNGRGVYSFCMCPGGYVVNASSEDGLLAVNGMSDYKRDGKNANSAVIVTVTPDDFEEKGPLSGMEFQRKWERAAYLAGNGNIPVQLFGDFKKHAKSTGPGSILPEIKGTYLWTDLSPCLPTKVAETLIEGITAFDRKIKGFAADDAVLSGVETRTSSPVRILRDERLQSNKRGVYPCGEGAGYAGGITSAAMDGMKVFEAIAGQFTPDY